ncbi:MAG: hypothetical protein RL348_1107 [Bacteroidota bacterium]
MKRLLCIFVVLLLSIASLGQGFNHQWLLGSYNFLQDPKGRMFIDASSYSILNENRKMPFKGTQGNICDANGNFLMSSNGVWIANANNDTMMNGSGLNPGGVTGSWPYGLPFVGNSVFIPYPDDSTQYVLFHHTASNPPNSICTELFYSTIDITLDSGLGAVLAKNILAIQDSLSGGIGICRHANGRDWWVIMLEDGNDNAYIVLFTHLGISSIVNQSMMYLPVQYGNIAQPTFNSQGDKFIATTYDNPIDRNSFIIISDFNRCSGVFNNTQTIQLTSGSYIFGVSFSPNGEFAYACTETEIFQVNTTTLAVDTVAIYDGFISPPSSTCCPSTFFNMYLAADGKIYITSGSGVRHFSVINYPDNAGMACDVQQHAVFIGNYAHLSAVPHHPNYYLGCDTTLGCPCFITGIDETQGHNFKFSVSPNPTTGSVKMVYMLPQNKSGKMEAFDITGRMVYSMSLPPWSTLQMVDLSHLQNGLYNIIIDSDNQRVSTKIILLQP